MVKLCAHHRKQFLLVLNGLCTEESFKNSKSQSASVPDVNISNLEENSPCVSDLCTREISIQSDSLETSINAAFCAEMENCHREVAHKIDLVKPQDLLCIQENSVTEIPFLNNCSPSTCHYQENIAKKHILHVKPTDDNSQLLQSDESGCITKLEPLQSDFPESCVLSHSNLPLTSVTGAPEAEFHTNLPKCADKENSQCISPRPTNLDKDSDCNVKHNSVHTVVVTKLGNHLNNYDYDAVTENPLSNLHKIKPHENIKNLKTAKRCKNSSNFRKNDCDNQCDVVYISEPITAQYHLQHQKSFLYTRNTARKSTRGYLFNEECCQLSTVRTLVRSSKVEDRGNCALHFSEALIIPDGVLTETLPLTDVSLDHSKSPCLGIDTDDSLSQNGMPDPLTCQESCSTDELSSVMEQSVSDSLLAVLSLVHEKDKSPCFAIPSTPHNCLQNRPVDMEAQGDIILDIGKLHGDHIEKCPPEAALSCDSVNEGKHVTLTSFDVGHTESLKDGTVLYELNNVEGIAANEGVSQMTIKQVHVPLENSRASSFISSSVVTLSNELENSEITMVTPFCLQTQKNAYTLDSSMEMPKEHSSSETVFNGRIENTFEDSTDNILQKKFNFSNHVTYLEEIFEDRSGITLQKNEHFITEQQYSDNDSAHVKPTDKIELTNNATDPVEVKICSTSNYVDKISTENVYDVLDTCAKVCQPSEYQCNDVSVTEQDVQPCHSDTSFEHVKNFNFEEISIAKNLSTAKLGKLENILASNNINGKISRASRKKFKKNPVPSDRRLRSREAQTDVCVKRKASLHIQISPCSSSKTPYRSVEFSTECATPCEHLMQINLKENNGENNFVQFLSDQFAKEKLLLSERMFKNTISFTPKPLENVSIHFEIGSNQRKVFFCSESKNCFKLEGEDSTCSPAILKNDCPLKFKKFSKQDPDDKSISFARTRSKVKCVAINSLTEYKGKRIKAEKVDHLYVENKQPSRCKKSFFTNLESSKDKEIVRPKFIDWCFEEESQERISNLNNKYSSVHNNWIPLEKDVSVGGPKSKNKADKLKEIWKTKKRVRKSKTMEEAQRYSPIQMLFMDSYKFSDICRWFLDTTETKSLAIVKKLNTRLPEEHQLPVPPSQKPSIESLYPYTLQAERLKKHLKKFASVYPACNDSKTQNSILKLNSKVQLMETSKISVKGASNSKDLGSKTRTNKPSAHILRKYNCFREKLHPSPTLNEKCKATTSQNSAAKMDLVKDIRRLSSSKLNSHTSADPNSCKVEITDEKQKARKRPKDDHSIKPGVQKSKRRKTEVKQELVKKKHSTVRKALPTKKINCKAVRSNNICKLQAPKKQEASVLKKGKTKSAMQKKISKAQLVQKCQTRSSKLRPVPPVLSEQRITRTSQPWMKAFHRKLFTGSKSTKKTQLLEKRINRSLTDFSTQSR